MKLRMKMLVFIVVPVVILTAVSSFYSYYQSKAALEKQIMDTSNAQISYFSQELNRDLIVSESVVKNLAAIFSNKDLSTEEMLSLVTATKKGDPSLAEVFAGMADGRGIFDNWTPPPEWVPSVRPWYKEAIKGDTVAYSPIYEDLITKDLLVTVGHPIYRNGQKVGVAGIDISLKPILAKTENMKTGETSYTFVLNSVGDFITHPKYQKTDNIANINNEELYNFYQTVLKDGIAVRTIKVDGVEEFVRGSKIGNTGWVIANAIDVNELYAPVKKMMVTLVIMGVIIIALLVGVISTFTLNISKAIDQMKAEDDVRIRMMQENREQNDINALSSQYQAGKQDTNMGMGNIVQGFGSLGNQIGFNRMNPNVQNTANPSSASPLVIPNQGMSMASERFNPMQNPRAFGSSGIPYMSQEVQGTLPRPAWMNTNFDLSRF